MTICEPARTSFGSLSPVHRHDGFRRNAVAARGRVNRLARLKRHDRAAGGRPATIGAALTGLRIGGDRRGHGRLRRLCDGFAPGNGGGVKRLFLTGLTDGRQRRGGHDRLAPLRGRADRTASRRSRHRTADAASRREWRADSRFRRYRPDRRTVPRTRCNRLQVRKGAQRRLPGSANVRSTAIVLRTWLNSIRNSARTLAKHRVVKS